MNTKKLCAIIAFLVVNTLVFGQSNATELNEIIGLKGMSSETVLQDKGYHLEKVDKSSAGIYQNWWSSRRGKCVTVRIEDGRVKSVVNTDAFDCGKSGNSSSNHSSHNSSHNNNLNLSSLSGMSEPNASTKLQDHGYRVTNQFGSSVISMYWHKESNDKCLLMMVKNDRVTSVTKMSNSSMCKSGARSSSHNNYNGHSNSSHHSSGSDHGVTLYGDCSFKGSHKTLGVGRYDHDELGVGNDRVSSIRVPRGYKIIIYQDGGWRGSSKTLYEDNGCLEHGWNDHISSVKVERD
ncbi:hypothetical protein [Pseudotamlana agarivorans]|uniref:hypothetical protein n=1 Tax=Pseudotamlana agarivorans TaxID=481183 RepID=UPI00083206D8|nr:hypothetical protein [Tamlana agarivorans]